MAESTSTNGWKRRIDQARTRTAALVDRVGKIRPDAPLIDATLETHERDSSVGGGLLAGAIAFRLFLMVVPLFLVLYAALGFMNVSGGDIEELGDSASLSDAMIAGMERVGTDASRGRWVTLIIGMGALVWATRTTVRYIWVVHLLAWRQDRRRTPNQLRAPLVGMGVVAFLVVFVAMSQWLRSHTPGGGITVSVMIGVGVGLTWFAVSLTLPRADGAGWTSLIPGALLMGVASQVLHAFTVLYAVGRISRMSTTYGPFGIAMAMLAWLYMVGRCVVGSAMLNATLFDRQVRGVPNFARLDPSSLRRRWSGWIGAPDDADPNDGSDREPDG